MRPPLILCTLFVLFLSACAQPKGPKLAGCEGRIEAEKNGIALFGHDDGPAAQAAPDAPADAAMTQALLQQAAKPARTPKARVLYHHWPPPRQYGYRVVAYDQGLHQLPPEYYGPRMASRRGHDLLDVALDKSTWTSSETVRYIGVRVISNGNKKAR